MDSKRHKGEKTQILFKKLHPDAIVPTKKSDGAAGYDLFAIEAGMIKENSRALVGTGIAIAILDKNIYGRIAPRSSLSINGTHVGAGVIDSDYRGEIKVLLLNDNSVLHYAKGTRIAQLILERIADVEFVEVDNLPETERGDGGFGSTGK